MSSQEQFYAGIIQEGCPDSLKEMLIDFAKAAESLGIRYRSTGCALSAPFDAVHRAQTTVPAEVRIKPGIEDMKNREAFKEALRYRPDLEGKGPEVVRCVTRMSHVILGENLDTPVRQLVLWTIGGREGMRGYSTRPVDILRQVATWHNIDIINVQDIRSFIRMEHQIAQLRKQIQKSG